MARLHNEFIKFDKEIKLTPSRKEGLAKSRKAVREKIKSWFKENKPEDIQPRFWSQGSLEMNTAINPIVQSDGKRPYDLDDGVYFIRKEGDEEKYAPASYQNWIHRAVENHTSNARIKNTCVRVDFKDGHHLDLPAYYKDGKQLELAHRSEDWIDSDPLAFKNWFNEKKKGTNIERIVRILKAWKDYRQNENTHLKFPSGFALSILVANNYAGRDNIDESFRETVRNVHNSLFKVFQCLRPTTPIGENVFEDYSSTRRDDFLNNLQKLLEACDSAKDASNFKTASEHIRKQLGDRFPLGDDKEEKDKAKELADKMSAGAISPKPFARKKSERWFKH